MHVEVFHDLGVWGEKRREESKIAGTVMSEGKHSSCLDLSCVRETYTVTHFSLLRPVLGYCKQHGMRYMRARNFMRVLLRIIFARICFSICKAEQADFKYINKTKLIQCYAFLF